MTALAEAMMILGSSVIAAVGTIWIKMQSNAFDKKYRKHD